MTPLCLVAILHEHFGRMSFTAGSRKWVALLAVMFPGLLHQLWKNAMTAMVMMTNQTESIESRLYHGLCSFRARWRLGMVFNPE